MARKDTSSPKTFPAEAPSKEAVHQYPRPQQNRWSPCPYRRRSRLAHGKQQASRAHIVRSRLPPVGTERLPWSALEAAPHKRAFQFSFEAPSFRLQPRNSRISGFGWCIHVVQEGVNSPDSANKQHCSENEKEAVPPVLGQRSCLCLLVCVVHVEPIH